MISLEAVTSMINQDPKAWAVATRRQANDFEWNTIPPRWVGGQWRTRVIEPARTVHSRRFSGIDLPTTRFPAKVETFYDFGHFTTAQHPNSRFFASIAAFYQVQNDWILPVEIILFQNGRIFFRFQIGKLHKHSNEIKTYGIFEFQDAIAHEAKM